MPSAQAVVVKKIVNYKYILFTSLGLLLFCVTWFMSTGSRPLMNTAVHGATIPLLDAGWNYMPGVEPQADGLHVSYLGRAIVRQNGAPGQQNPSANAYGTHLKVPGDFMIRANVTAVRGTASLRLYGDLPVIQDEFRVEPKSLEIKLTNNSVAVSTWNGITNQNPYRQLPTSAATYSVRSQGVTEIIIQRQADTLKISANGSQIAVLSKNNLFRDEVWFGMTAENPGDSWILSQLDADAAAGASGVNTQSVAAYGASGQGLQTLASKKRPGFLVGAAIALNPAVADTAYARLAFGGNFGQVTTENALKWQFIHPQPATYDFREADALVALAKKNNLAVNGHTLVFGEANPDWVQRLPVDTAADKNHVRQVMVDHIAQSVGHFKGKIASWDVVNEPLADYDTPAGVDGLRQHIWYKALGEDYIATAFMAARQADPQTKLFINEFGLEADDDRWQTFLTLVTKLKAQGVPIDGVGFQAHVYESGDEIDPAVLRNHIRALAKIGIVSRISEMDVHDTNGVAAQGAQYASIFGACLAEQSCVSWSTWGITDRYDMSLDDRGNIVPGSDFLWDKNSSPKEAVSAIRATLSR